MSLAFAKKYLALDHIQQFTAAEYYQIYISHHAFHSAVSWREFKAWLEQTDVSSLAIKKSELARWHVNSYINMFNQWVEDFSEEERQFVLEEYIHAVKHGLCILPYVMYVYRHCISIHGKYHQNFKL